MNIKEELQVPPRLIRKYKYKTCYFFREKDILKIIFPNEVKKIIIEIPFQSFKHALRCDFGDKNKFIKNPKKVIRVITREQRLEILKRQNYYCNICGSQLKNGPGIGLPGWLAHIDHIHPFSMRHTYLYGEENINETQNLQALCSDCNLSKGARMG